MKLVIALVLIAFAISMMSPRRTKRVTLAVDPPASVVFAIAGGKVEEVLVRPGAHVLQGQVLMRARVRDTGETSGQLREAMIRLQRLPDPVWKQAEQSDPKRVAADEAYIDRLAEWERTKSPASKLRLERATAAREAEYRRPSPFSKQAFVNWQNSIGRYDIRATASGRLEIFDWKLGDELPPLARVALIAQ